MNFDFFEMWASPRCIWPRPYRFSWFWPRECDVLCTILLYIEQCIFVCLYMYVFELCICTCMNLYIFTMIKRILLPKLIWSPPGLFSPSPPRSIYGIIFHLSPERTQIFLSEYIYMIILRCVVHKLCVAKNCIPLGLSIANVQYLRNTKG